MASQSRQLGHTVLAGAGFGAGTAHPDSSPRPQAPLPVAPPPLRGWGAHWALPTPRPHCNPGLLTLQALGGGHGVHPDPESQGLLLLSVQPPPSSCPRLPPTTQSPATWSLCPSVLGFPGVLEWVGAPLRCCLLPGVEVLSHAQVTHVLPLSPSLQVTGPLTSRSAQAAVEGPDQGLLQEKGPVPLPAYPASELPRGPGVSWWAPGSPKNLAKEGLEPTGQARPCSEGTWLWHCSWALRGPFCDG